MEIDLKQLEEACVLFYNNQNRTSQAEAHNWLQIAANSFQAWSFCWELMQPGKSCEVQFFGATTLHSKLMKSWHEIPPEMQQELKQKLLDAITLFAPGPKLVLNRLCISLSAFIVHMLKDWPTAVDDVIALFQNQPLPNVDQNTQLWILLEILTGIPEEANVIYTSVQRALIRHEITKRTGTVIRLVEQYIRVKCDAPGAKLEDDDMPALQNAAKCAKEWINYAGYSLNEAQSFIEALLKLVNKCYWASVEADGCMSSDESELASICLKTLSSLMVQPDAHKYANTALSIMRLFLDSLCDITRVEWKENNLNEDIAFAIYTLLISSIECHSRVILAGIASENRAHNELYMRLVNEILLCTDKPGTYPVEESCSALAMGFWYMLQDEVLSMENVTEKTKCMHAIRPVYSHLVKILIRKSQLPPEDSRDKWCSDDLETFRCYRQDIADTLLFCHEVLNETILVILNHQLDEALAGLQTSFDNWARLEAVVHAYCALAQQIEDDQGYAQIAKLMGVLNEFPYEKLNEKLLGTALETVGAYSEWLKLYPTFLPPAIQLLLKGLDSSMSSQATLSLKDLSTECQLQLKPYSEPLLQECQRILLSGSLSNSESVRLMYSIGKLMSLLPIEQITIFLDSLVSPCFEELQQLATAGALTAESKTRTIFRLNMVSTLFSSLNTTKAAERPQMQPILVVLERTMPIWKQICDMWMNESQVIETLCSALNHALVNLMDDIKPLLNDLCCLILAIFQNKCVPPAIEIAGTCITMFCKDEHFQIMMKQLLAEILLYNFRLFEQTADNKLSDISDLIETFYAFNAKIVKRMPIAYAELNVDCQKLIGFALKGVMLPETGPIKKCTSFLVTFTKESRAFPNLTNAILEKGEEIVRVVLMCIGGVTPRTHVDVFADIFLALNAKYPSEFIAWFKVLTIPNFPTGLVSEQEKNHFMKQIIKEKVNKRLVQDHIRKFAAKSRGVCEEIL